MFPSNCKSLDCFFLRKIGASCIFDFMLISFHMVCFGQSLDCRSAVCHGEQHVDQCHVLKLESFFTSFAWFVAACIKQLPPIPSPFSQLCGQELLYCLRILWQCLILVRRLALCTSLRSLLVFIGGNFLGAHIFLLNLLSDIYILCSQDITV